MTFSWRCDTRQGQDTSLPELAFAFVLSAGLFGLGDNLSRAFKKWKSAANQADNAARALAGQADNVLDNVAGQVDNILEDVASHGDNIVADIASKADDVAGDLASHTDDIARTMDSVADQADDLAQLGTKLDPASAKQRSIIESIENSTDGTRNLTNLQKGNYGEMKMDEFFEKQGYQRLTEPVTDLDAVSHHGIDGVYYKPDGHPPYIIGEAKFGSSRLSVLADGTPQMSADWIEAQIGSVSRLDAAVGKDLADRIIEEGYDSMLVKIDASGNITTRMLDAFGKIIK